MVGGLGGSDLSHRTALALLIVGAAVWGGAWSTVSFEDGAFGTAMATNAPAPFGSPVEWGPQVVTAQDQAIAAVSSAARLIVAGGAGVFGIAAISALLLFASSRTAHRPALRIHRAVGASVRRLRAEATWDAVLAVGVTTVGAAALGLGVARVGAVAWSRGMELGETDPAFLMPLIAVALLAPALGAIVAALFRRSVPVRPLPSSTPRYVPDPFSGFAVTQVAVSVAALLLVTVIPVGPQTRTADTGGDWLEVRAATPIDTQQLSLALAGVAGVAGVYAASPGAWSGLGAQDFVLSQCGRCFIGGLPTPLKGEVATHLWAAPGTLARLGIEIEEGRPFLDEDFVSDTRVVMVSRDYANANFERGQALGRKVRVGQDADSWYEVVGVVTDGPDSIALGASGQVAPWVVVPARPGTLVALGLRIDGTAAQADLAAAVEGAIDVDALEIRAYERFVSLAGFPATWLRGWLLFFGATALLVSLIGVFTATRAQIRQRSVELAIRRTLGASRSDIVRSVLGQATRIALIGAPLGVWVATFALQSLHRTSGVMFPAAAVVASLLVAVWLMCLVGGLPPALRLAGLPPVEALRRAERASQ